MGTYKLSLCQRYKQVWWHWEMAQVRRSAHVTTCWLLGLAGAPTEVPVPPDGSTQTQLVHTVTPLRPWGGTGRGTSVPKLPHGVAGAKQECS